MSSFFQVMPTDRSRTTWLSLHHERTGRSVWTVNHQSHWREHLWYSCWLAKSLPYLTNLCLYSSHCLQVVCRALFLAVFSSQSKPHLQVLSLTQTALLFSSHWLPQNLIVCFNLSDVSAWIRDIFYSEAHVLILQASLPYNTALATIWYL